ncbi:MAG: trigger factor [Clostridia bacterium]
MSYTKESLEKNQVKFSFDVSEADWKDAIDQAYNKTKGKYQIGGFRRGHVPRKVIEGMYGVGVFFDDALDIILPKYYDEAMDAEKDIFPVDRPEISIDAITDTTLKFSATVQLRPEVKLGQYTGLEFRKDKVKVSKEEIEVETKKALEQAATFEKVADRAAQNGDNTIIDYSGSVDGVKFEGGTAEKQPLTLGSGQFIPGFEEQVVGMNIGESKDVKVTFPAEYGSKDLAGKEAVFAVVLHEINEKKMPAYDDEFVKDVSEFDTVADYEKSIKEIIKNKKEEEANSKLESDIIDKIASLAELEVPQCMVDRQAEEMVQDIEYRMQYQGLKPEDYYKMLNTTRDDVKKNYNDTAAKNVRSGLVVSELVKAITIPVDEEEVVAEIKSMAEKAGKSFEEYEKNINEEYRGYIRNDIITTKLFAYLKNNNEIK